MPKSSLWGNNDRSEKVQPKERRQERKIQMLQKEDSAWIWMSSTRKEKAGTASGGESSCPSVNTWWEGARKVEAASPHWGPAMGQEALVQTEIPFTHRKMVLIARMTKFQNRLPRGYAISKIFSRPDWTWPWPTCCRWSLLGQRGWAGWSAEVPFTCRAPTFHGSVISALSLAQQEGSVSHAHLL